jgi:hypothetical protein
MENGRFRNMPLNEAKFYFPWEHRIPLSVHSLDVRSCVGRCSELGIPLRAYRFVHSEGILACSSVIELTCSAFGFQVTSSSGRGGFSGQIGRYLSQNSPPWNSGFSGSIVRKAAYNNNSTFTWPGPRMVAGYAEAHACGWQLLSHFLHMALFTRKVY